MKIVQVGQAVLIGVLVVWNVWLTMGLYACRSGLLDNFRDITHILGFLDLIQ